MVTQRHYLSAAAVVGRNERPNDNSNNRIRQVGSGLILAIGLVPVFAWELSLYRSVSDYRAEKRQRPKDLASLRRTSVRQVGKKRIASSVDEQIVFWSKHRLSKGVTSTAYYTTVRGKNYGYVNSFLKEGLRLVSTSMLMAKKTSRC